jgi:hypothetical protein
MTEAMVTDLIFLGICAVIALIAWIKWHPRDSPPAIIKTPEDYYDHVKRTQAARKKRLKAQKGDDDA